MQSLTFNSKLNFLMSIATLASVLRNTVWMFRYIHQLCGKVAAVFYDLKHIKYT